MLFAPTLADKAILPTAWRGRYFFNRIGRQLPFQEAALAKSSRRLTPRVRLMSRAVELKAFLLTTCPPLQGQTGGDPIKMPIHVPRMVEVPTVRDCNGGLVGAG